MLRLWEGEIFGQRLKGQGERRGWRQGIRQRQKGKAMKGAGTKGLGKSGEAQGRTTGRTAKLGMPRTVLDMLDKTDTKSSDCRWGWTLVDEEDSHRRSGSSSGPQPESDED